MNAERPAAFPSDTRERFLESLEAPGLRGTAISPAAPYTDLGNLPSSLPALDGHGSEHTLAGLQQQTANPAAPQQSQASVVKPQSRIRQSLCGAGMSP